MCRISKNAEIQASGTKYVNNLYISSKILRGQKRNLFVTRFKLHSTDSLILKLDHGTLFMRAHFHAVRLEIV